MTPGLPVASSAVFRPPLEREAVELAGEPRLEGMGMHVAHRVQQSGHLTLPGPDHARIGVTRRRHSESGGQVQIPFAVRIPDVNAAGPLPDDRPRTVRRNASDVPRFVLAEQLQNLAGAHASAPTLAVPFARRKTTACARRWPELALDRLNLRPISQREQANEFPAARINYFANRRNFCPTRLLE